MTDMERKIINLAEVAITRATFLHLSPWLVEADETEHLLPWNLETVHWRSFKRVAYVPTMIELD